MDTKVDLATLAVNIVLLVFSAVFALLVLFVPGSWSLHSQKNKAYALSVVAVVVSLFVQLFGINRSGATVNIAHVAPHVELLELAPASTANSSALAVRVAMDTTLYANGTRVVLCVRDMGDSSAKDVAYDAFDMDAEPTTAGVAVEPSQPLDIGDEEAKWTVANLTDGHAYLFAVVPATETRDGEVRLQSQWLTVEGTRLDVMLHSAACEQLRDADIKRVDMRIFHACTWSAENATCTPLEQDLCAFQP